VSNCWKLSKCFPKWLYHLFPHQKCMSSDCPTTSPTLGSVISVVIMAGVQGFPTVAVICVSLMSSNVGCLSRAHWLSGCPSCDVLLKSLQVLLGSLSIVLGLNSGLHACKAGTLLFEPHLQSILLWLFWRPKSHELFSWGGLKP
jgi:hypothetical protein